MLCLMCVCGVLCVCVCVCDALKNKMFRYFRAMWSSITRNSTVKSLIQDAPNPKLKCFSSLLAVVFVQYIEAKC